MKSIYKYLMLIVGVSALVSCEQEYDNPIDELTQVNLFVQYAAGTPGIDEPLEVEEGSGSEEFTIQAPISKETDLIAEVSFSGDAEYGVDFEVDGDSLLTASATGATFYIKYEKTNNTAVTVDQTDFTIDFIDDAVADGDKTLVVTLVGAKGATDSSIQLDGGRGAIRKTITAIISDHE